MAEINAHTISSDQRAVGLRTRPDLVVEEGVYQGEYCWIIKDPLAMKYFRLRRPEYLGAGVAARQEGQLSRPETHAERRVSGAERPPGDDPTTDLSTASIRIANRSVLGTG